MYLTYYDIERSEPSKLLSFCGIYFLAFLQVCYHLTRFAEAFPVGGADLGATQAGPAKF